MAFNHSSDADQRIGCEMKTNESYVNSSCPTADSNGNAVLDSASKARSAGILPSSIPGNNVSKPAATRPFAAAQPPRQGGQPALTANTGRTQSWKKIICIILVNILAFAVTLIPIGLLILRFTKGFI